MRFRLTFTLTTSTLAALFIAPASAPTSLAAAEPGPFDFAQAKQPEPGAVWLEDLDWSDHTEKLTPRQSAKQTPLTVAGRVFPHGLGGVGRTQLLIDLGGRGRRLLMAVGIDDIEKSIGSKSFEVWLDGRLAAKVGPLRKGDIKQIDVELTSAQQMELVVAHGGHESDWDRFALGGAQIVMANPAHANDKAKWPRPFKIKPEPTVSIARGRDPRTHINGARLVGATVGRPFQHRLAVSGQGPLRVSVSGLPDGVTFDPSSRTLRGKLPEGRFPVGVEARGPKGRAKATITLVGGREPGVKALTPIMGWNSWNLWGEKVDATKIKAAAEAMLASGLADYGFTYVNIDDGWEGQRDPAGQLQPNERFGDIANLAKHVHELGLKIGIYSSPGPETCAKYPGSYKHEAIDARTWAAWGVDLLKYDWCSYDKIAPNFSIPEQRRPYDVMQSALAQVDRDIVYSVCNYGRGEVWTWGKAAGGNMWRTTSDITDTWVSLDGIGFSQQEKLPFTQPGHVGDPDMLVVGKVGWGEVRPTRLSGNEQILHVTHWSMLAAPLLLGCDLTNLDAFTMDLLTNSEVLAVDQDALVKPATRRISQGRTEVWTRPLADGGTAVALYNRGPRRTQVQAPLSDLGLQGSFRARDLWQRKEMGVIQQQLKAEVPQHGAVMIKLLPVRTSSR